MTTFTSPATHQQIQASIQPGKKTGEQVITCTWKMEGSDFVHEESSTWIDGEGWEDDTLGAWSPILEGLFNLTT